MTVIFTEKESIGTRLYLSMQPFLNVSIATQVFTGITHEAGSQWMHG